MTADVLRPGDYVTLSIVDAPLLVVRGEDRVVRAFQNICRHRGTRVAEGRGSGTKSFTCRFHGWSYRLDGRLINPTHRRGFEGLDPDCHGLVEVACDESAGLVFVHIDGAADTLNASEWLTDVGAELVSLDLAGLHHFETRASTRAMNWKLMADTFCEQYHLRHLHHASFSPTIYSDNSLYDVYGLHGRMVTPSKSIDHQLDHQRREDWHLLRHVILNYMIVPNTVLLVQEEFVELFQLLPDGPERAISMCTLYSREPADTDAARRRLTRAFDFLLDVVDTEDYEMCEQTQRSFRSGAQRHLVFGRNEPGLIHFHRSIEALLQIAPTERSDAPIGPRRLGHRGRRLSGT
jgi:phenylpropionate dioxygenase-like ring-hydroxylating dioxygenase large terminal subunit